MLSVPSLTNRPERPGALVQCAVCRVQCVCARTSNSLLNCSLLRPQCASSKCPRLLSLFASFCVAFLVSLVSLFLALSPLTPSASIPMWPSSRVPFPSTCSSALFAVKQYSTQMLLQFDWCQWLSVIETAWKKEGKYKKKKKKKKKVKNPRKKLE